MHDALCAGSSQGSWPHTIGGSSAWSALEPRELFVRRSCTSSFWCKDAKPREAAGFGNSGNGPSPHTRGVKGSRSDSLAASRSWSGSRGNSLFSVDRPSASHNPVECMLAAAILPHDSQAAGARCRHVYEAEIAAKQRHLPKVLQARLSVAPQPMPMCMRGFPSGFVGDSAQLGSSVKQAPCPKQAKELQGRLKTLESLFDSAASADDDFGESRSLGCRRRRNWAELFPRLEELAKPRKEYEDPPLFFCLRDAEGNPIIIPKRKGPLHIPAIPKRWEDLWAAESEERARRTGATDNLVATASCGDLSPSHASPKAKPAAGVAVERGDAAKKPKRGADSVAAPKAKPSSGNITESGGATNKVESIEAKPGTGVVAESEGKTGGDTTKVETIQAKPGAGVVAESEWKTGGDTTKVEIIQAKPGAGVVAESEGKTGGDTTKVETIQAKPETGVVAESEGKTGGDTSKVETIQAKSGIVLVAGGEGKTGGDTTKVEPVEAKPRTGGVGESAGNLGGDTKKVETAEANSGTGIVADGAGNTRGGTQDGETTEDSKSQVVAASAVEESPQPSAQPSAQSAAAAAEGSKVSNENVARDLDGLEAKAPKTSSGSLLGDADVAVTAMGGAQAAALPTDDDEYAFDNEENDIKVAADDLVGRIDTRPPDDDPDAEFERTHDEVEVSPVARQRAHSYDEFEDESTSNLNNAGPIATRTASAKVEDDDGFEFEDD